MESVRGDKVVASGFERHLQTGLAMALVALVGWGGNKAGEGLESLARFDERLKSIEMKLERIEDTALKVRELEIRLGSVEKKLEARQ